MRKLKESLLPSSSEYYSYVIKILDILIRYNATWIKQNLLVFVFLPGTLDAEVLGLMTFSKKLGIMMSFGVVLIFTV